MDRVPLESLVPLPFTAMKYYVLIDSLRSDGFIPMDVLLFSAMHVIPCSRTVLKGQPWL